jgi:hypothetical protein
LSTSPLDLLVEAAIRVGRPTQSWRLGWAGTVKHLPAEILPPRVAGPVLREAEAMAERSREPLGSRDVEAALREAWDDNPRKVLDEFEDEPAAVTPSSQVHRGVLEGEPVAIKVLRAGISEIVRADITVAQALLAPAGRAFPAGDPAGLLAELRRRLLEELDLEHQAEIQRVFARSLRDSAHFAVPMPVSRLAAPRVHVAPWIDGEPPGPDDAAALVTFFAGALGEGLVHGDPDLDDIRRLPDGRLAFLDFSSAGHSDEGRAAQMAAALSGLADDDAAATAASLAALGWFSAEADGRAAHALAREIGEPLLGGPVRLDLDLLATARDRALARWPQLEALAARFSAPPQDIWPLRMAWQLTVALARLGATADWPALVARALDHGWSENAPARGRL